MEKKDFTDLGKQIENAVQDALNSKDFAKLKQEIRQTVDCTIEEVRSGIKSGLEYKDVKYKEVKKTYKDAKKSPKEAKPIIKELNVDKTYKDAKKVLREVKPAIRELKTREVRQMQGQIKAPVLICKRPVGAVSNVLYSIFGYVGISVSSVLAISFIALLIANAGYSPFIGMLASIWIPLLTVSAVCTARGGNIRKRLKRFRLYVRYLQGRAYCSVKELASHTGQSPQFIVKDLRKMISLGMFPEGHLDEQHSSLMLTNETYRHYLSAQDSLRRRQIEERKQLKQKSIIEKVEEPKASVNDELQNAIEEGRMHLMQIREANNVIVGEDISGKLDRLEVVISKIFGYIEKRPQKLPEIRKFMSYYLPTTLKLVNAYREFDEQIVQGDNITKAKTEIKDTLDTINSAFENLLDSLYQDDVMDISTDITVLETMLAQEGLTEGSINKHPQ